jgi:hypothetical protein
MQMKKPRGPVVFIAPSRNVSILSATLLWLSAGVLLAEPTLIFFDDFNREEVSSETEDVGNGWTTNTHRRAPGKRQALLRDGALVACLALWPDRASTKTNTRRPLENTICAIKVHGDPRLLPNTPGCCLR